jgi:anaerobic selenocysteine-containing dehydrogenase
VPFVVALTSFLDETSLQADLLLPSPTALERWQCVPAAACDGSVVVTISRPVAQAGGEARPLEEVLMQLAKAYGPPVEGAFPWQSLEQLVREQVQSLYEAKTGGLLPQIALPGQPLPQEHDTPTTTFEKFWEQILTRGGLVWPSESAPWPEFHTPSGRCELFPQQMRAGLELWVSSGVGRSASPQTDYPLQLYLYTPLAFLNGYGAHLPFLQQIAGSQLHEAWETWAELHPETAKQVGVRDGDPIRIASARGSVHAKARVVEGVAPEVIAMPLGLGHSAPVSWAQGIGANPAQLVGRTLDMLTHQPLWQDTWVRIWKV